MTNPPDRREDEHDLAALAWFEQTGVLTPRAADIIADDRAADPEGEDYWTRLLTPTPT